ncbi:hypothetical protein IAU60_001225 [Kwoniella sp. DSM 27419]
MVPSLPSPKPRSKPKPAGPSSGNSPLTQIPKLEAALLDTSSYDPNPLLPLIHLARGDSPEVVHKAVWALHRVFIRYIGENKVGGLNGDLAVRGARLENAVVDGEDARMGGEEREVKAWVRERLLDYVEVLGGLVRDIEPGLRTSTPVIHTPYFRLILHYLFSPTASLRGAKAKAAGGWRTIAANQVEEDEGVLPADVARIVVDDFWAKYDDIRWAFFKETANTLQTSSSLADPSNLLSQLLPLTNLPKTSDDINTFYIPSFATPPAGATAGGKKKKAKKGKTRYTGEVDALPDWMAEYESSGSEADSGDEQDKGKAGRKRTRQRTSQMSIHASVYSVLSHTTWYTTLWEAVLSSVRLDDLWTRKILVGLHGEQGILGHFKPERRLRIADWLGSLVDGGGALAMLAMNGLFVLITHDYPHFYERLYALLDANVMHVKYRARFFRLLDVFLASSLISSALVASFIKRLSRLALTAPPAGVILIIPFIYNLFKRHPGCMIMLQRPSISVLAVSFQPQAGPEAAAERYAEIDPYDADETSPLKTKALDSSCWELAALQKHYLGPIATLAKIFGDVFTKPEFNMEDFLDHGYGTTESSRKIKNPPALSISVENATAETMPVLFPPASVERADGEGDLVSQLWAF